LVLLSLEGFTLEAPWFTIFMVNHIKFFSRLPFVLTERMLSLIKQSLAFVLSAKFTESTMRLSLVLWLPVTKTNIKKKSKDLHE
jgi:hypothetical protein